MSHGYQDQCPSSLSQHQDHQAGVEAADVLLQGSGCVGQVLPASEILPVWAGPGIPVSNRRSLETVCRWPVEGFHLWPEWSSEEQKQLLPMQKPALLKVYGREILMLLNHCPKRAAEGLTAGRDRCKLCYEAGMACGMQDAALTDQKGYRFPLQRTVFPEGCILRVLGALPTNLCQYDEERRGLGAGMLLHFTTESRQQQAAITRHFAAIRDGAEPEKPTGTTAGHWRRGIE